MGNIKVGLTPANQSEGITEQEGRPLRRSSMSSRVTSAVKFLDVGMEIEEELTSLLLTLDREKIICIVEHLTDVIGVQQKSDLLFVEAEDLKPFLTPIQIRKLLLAFKGDGNRPENLNDTITLEPCPAASAETSSHPPHPSSSTSTTMYNHYSSSWVSHLQIPWERFPLRLSHAITRGDRAHPEDRRSMIRIVVEAMQVLCRNPKRASCEEVAKIIVNRYPQTFADFTEKGERLGCGHYSLLRSIKSRVEHVNRDNTTHRLRQTKRTRNEEDYSPNSNATSPKKVRCLVDSYGCINWQPVELPEGETPASLEEKKHILLTIFNSEGPGAVERPDVHDFMCLIYISQHQLINSCPSLSVAEIQEQWPFLFTRKDLSNHFYKLTGIDISERLGQALITKGRRIINYFSSQKLKWNLGIRTLIQQIESEGVLTNNKVGTATILLMMKYYKEDEDSLFVLADETSTRMSLEAESNLPITPRLIMLGQSSMTATCWMVSAEGRGIVEMDKENTFADAMSVFFGSFYVLNLEYQESACATLELIQRFFVRINPEEGTKCTSKVGTSRRTGTTVKQKVVHINPHVTTFLQRLTEFEWRTSN
ncbi:uncharacterized protein LOC109199438 isoform X1 [Oreochromis niloticus]|uniref:uncharacterized protein LOC109199438 isoform X1 n=2 Tax=Oreochromis niloticus TaxID=8128 RepID=UPI000DF2DED5|nr:uncharacterized protein LOC109199438 isoform X1 [Oreochromis niloticus]